MKPALLCMAVLVCDLAGPRFSLRPLPPCTPNIALLHYCYFSKFTLIPYVLFWQILLYLFTWEILIHPSCLAQSLLLTVESPWFFQMDCRYSFLPPWVSCTWYTPLLSYCDSLFTHVLFKLQISWWQESRNILLTQAQCTQGNICCLRNVGKNPITMIITTFCPSYFTLAKEKKFQGFSVKQT